MTSQVRELPSTAIPVEPDGPGLRPSFLRPFFTAVGGRLLPWLVPLVLVAAWQAASSFGWLSTRVLPAPNEVLRAAWALAESGDSLAIGRREPSPGVQGEEPELVELRAIQR